MTSAPVTDVKMYFTNVATKAADAAANLTSGLKTNDETASFAKALDNTAGKSVEETKVNDDRKSAKPESKNTGREVPGKRQEELTSNKDDIKEAGKEENATDTEQKTGLYEVTYEKAGEIRDAIKNTLKISDEELDEAMQLLNLSFQDLLNPDSVRELVMTLSGAEDTISLLTDANLYSDVKEVLSLVEDADRSIEEEYGLPHEDFMNILEDSDFSKVMDEQLQSGKTEEPEQMVIQGETDASEDDLPISKDTENEGPRVEIHTTDSAKEIGASKESTDDNKDEVITEKAETEGSEVVNKAVAEDKSQGKQSSLNDREQNKSSDNGNSQGTEKTMDANPLVNNVSNTVITTDANGNVIETRSFIQNFRNAELVRQVTEYIKVNVGADTTSMEMQLHPASLGTVNMQLISMNGEITAHLTVQSEAVRAALETQFVTLQESFDEQGIKVSAVEVSVANYDLDRGPNEDRDDRHERQTAGGVKGRRRINLADLSETDLDDMNDDDQLAARIMAENGNSIDYTA